MKNEKDVRMIKSAQKIELIETTERSKTIPWFRVGFIYNIRTRGAIYERARVVSTFKGAVRVTYVRIDRRMKALTCTDQIPIGTIISARRYRS